MSRVIAAFAQFFDSSGDPLENGWIEFLASNTTSTQKPTYSDSAQQIPNANPLQLGADGRCPDAFGTGAYRVRLYEKNPVTGLPGTLIQEFDPVTADCDYLGAGENFAEWDGTVTYQVANIVTYLGNYYTSIAANNIANVPSSSSPWWEQVSWIHHWNINAIYETDDVAVYSGSLYFSLSNGNAGNVPLTSPAWWNPVGSGTILLNWEESGTTFQPKVSGYDLGSLTNLIGDVFIGDGYKIQLGDDQDLEIYHDGANAFISNSTGALNLDEWAVDSSGHLSPNASDTYNIGSAVVGTILNLYMGNAGEIYFGSDQEIYHDGVDGYFLCNTGTLYIGTTTADTLEFQINSQTEWTIDASGNLLPRAANVLNIGDGSHELLNLYIGASGKLYLGNALNFQIWHTGTYAYFNSNSYLFQTGGTTRWVLDSGGNLYPQGYDNYNIGRASGGLSKVLNIYIGEAGALYFGLDDDLEIYHDGANGYIVNNTGLLYLPDISLTGDIHLLDTGAIYFGTDDDFSIYHNGTAAGILNDTGELFISVTPANSITFRTTDTSRWQVSATGIFQPMTADTYDIGSTTFEVRNIYLGEAGRLYFGLDQDMSLFHNGVSSYVSNTGSTLTIRTTTAHTIAIAPNNINAWGFISTGHINPLTADTYDIGGTAFEVRNIYIGEAGRLYLGLDQDMSVYHNGTNGFITNGTGILTIDFGGPIQLVGSGSPEGVVTAVVGSIYTDTAGGASTTLYIKESGTGNTGWVAK